MDNFWKEIETYATISLAARKEWEYYLTERLIKKGDILLMAGGENNLLDTYNSSLFLGMKKKVQK